LLSLSLSPSLPLSLSLSLSLSFSLCDQAMQEAADETDTKLRKLQDLSRADQSKLFSLQLQLEATGREVLDLKRWVGSF
jgi:hypothetical protein